MILKNALPSIRYFAALLGCAVLWPWLGSPSGNQDSVIAESLTVGLMFLILIDFSFQLHSRIYQRAIPSLLALSTCGLGFFWHADSYVVIGALIAISTSILGIFTVVLDRVRKGGPFVVFLFFLVPIFVGANVLTFPRCQLGEVPLTSTEAFFTAVSAVTVTGLSVIDIGTRLSIEGQCFLLALIQLGGLGMVSLFAFFALVLGNGLGIRQGRSIRESLDGLSSSDLRQLLVTICVFTILIEALGAVTLYYFGESSPSALDSVFHSVSAFCNAGFTLPADSLASWNQSSKIIMAVLVILGGLGFPVIHEFQRRIFDRETMRFTIQTKIILSVSLVLVCGGTVLLSVIGAGPESWFWSITARTAGFSTASARDLPMAATLIMLVLMIIGASPGSTGGGLKTTTLGILFLATRSEISGSQKVVAWKRTIPDAVVRSAAVLTVLAAILWLLLVVLLLLVESTSLQAGRFSFLDLIFEVTSALGTVGLSRDVTGQLSDAGLWIVESAMILGRLGPLAVVIAIASLSPVQLRGERPAGKVMLG